MAHCFKLQWLPLERIHGVRHGITHEIDSSISGGGQGIGDVELKLPIAETLQE